MFKDVIWRRLLPLYIASFSQGLILWYAIEKVFMTSIGFDASQIALVVIIGSTVGLLLEFPSGILADRWSRKGVLALSYVALALVSLLFGLADSVLEYTLASVLFAVHMALHSGSNDSIVYDTLLEETGSRKGYEQYYSYTTMFASAGLVIGSLLGGVIGDLVGLEAAYFLSIPGAAAAVISLLFLKEPTLHKKAVGSKLIQHVGETMKLVMQPGMFRLLLAALVAFGLLHMVLFGIDQLWPLALALPVIWYGPLNAVLLLGYGIGAPLAARIAGRPLRVYMAAALAVLFMALLTVANMPVIAVAQTGGIIVLTAILVVLYGKMHDNLPSQLRSGSSSAVSTLRTLAYLPFVYIFGVVTELQSVFVAAYMLIPLALIGAYGVVRLHWSQKF